MKKSEKGKEYNNWKKKRKTAGKNKNVEINKRNFVSKFKRLMKKQLNAVEKEISKKEKKSNVKVNSNIQDPIKACKHLSKLNSDIISQENKPL